MTTAVDLGTGLTLELPRTDVTKRGTCRIREYDVETDTSMSDGVVHKVDIDTATLFACADPECIFRC